MGNVLTAPLQRLFFHVFTASGFAKTSISNLPGWFIVPGALFDEKEFDGDENAIVDFKYSASPKITWWFDHHQSAFLTPQDAEHYRTHDHSQKFYDPEFKSCTKFLAHVAQEKFAFDPAPVAELIHWADIIDGAQFES